MTYLRISALDFHRNPYDQMSTDYFKDLSQEFSQGFCKEVSKEFPKDFSKELPKDYFEKLFKDISYLGNSLKAFSRILYSAR